MIHLAVCKRPPASKPEAFFRLGTGAFSVNVAVLIAGALRSCISLLAECAFQCADGPVRTGVGTGFFRVIQSRADGAYCTGSLGVAANQGGALGLSRVNGSTLPQHVEQFGVSVNTQASPDKLNRPRSGMNGVSGSMSIPHFREGEF